MKYTFGEYLFEATSELILECLTDLSEEIVRDCCDYKVFLRGQEYYQEGMVEEISCNKANNTVTAMVTGTMEYDIEFYLEDKDVHSSCSCPYNGVCKHTIATLLLMVHEGTENISTFSLAGPTTVESLDFLMKYLETLPKKDLIQLVMKFAPMNFITEVKNREVPETDAEAIFIKTEKKIRKFFEDDELLFDPEGMETALMSQLNNLKGLEPRIKTEIGELLLFIIRSIDQAFNEGYLYLENYCGDDYFESEAFCEYVIAFVKLLPIETKTAYLVSLNQALDEMSYDTFFTIQNSYHRLFSEKEKEELKLYINSENTIAESLISRLYKTLESIMDTKESEALLRITSQKDQEQFIKLCQLLIEQNRFQETYDLIKNRSKSYYLRNTQIATIYLETAHKLNLNLEKISEEVAQKCPEASLLQKIKTLKGTVGDKCEEIVRRQNPAELLAFYEEENRLKEALAMVQEKDLFYDQTTFAFFKRNRNHFPAETESFLKDRIEEDLNYTGKNHYARIAESLDLMKRINPVRSRRIAEEIRTNFKRRTSLIGIIRAF